MSIGSKKIPPSEIQRKYLSGQVRAILHYQEKLDASDFDEKAPNATKVLKGTQSRLEMLVELIEGLLEDGASHVAAYRRALKEDPTDPYLKSFSWPENMEFTVSMKQKLKGMRLRLSNISLSLYYLGRHSTEDTMQRSEKKARGA